MLESLIQNEMVVVSAAGLTAMLSVVLVWMALVERDNSQRRLKALAAKRSAYLAGMTPRLGQGSRRAALMALADREKGLAVLRWLAEKFQLLRSSEAEKIALRLAQAGYRERDALIVFLVCKTLAPLVLGGAAAFWVFSVQDSELSELWKILLGLSAAVSGILLPEFVLRKLINNRKLALRNGLPDALDLLVVCAEAGLSLDMALDRVAAELMKASPVIAEELSMTSIELGFLPDRQQALHNFASRTGLEEISGVVSTLIQTEKYGTPLSQSLRVLSGEFRNERVMKAEEKAARLPATLTVPLIVFIMPALFIVLIGPAIISSIEGLSGL